MAGFPGEGKRVEIGLAWNQLAGPVSLSSCFDLLPGPGPQQVRGEITSIRRTGKSLKILSRNPRAESSSYKKNRNKPPRLVPWVSSFLPASCAGSAGTACVTIVLKLLRFFASLLAIALARQCRLYALLLAGLQVVGVTLDFLDDVFLLYLPLEPAKSVFQRLAFLYTNFCQRDPTSKPANWLFLEYRKEPAAGQTKVFWAAKTSSYRVEFRPN
jgi:hypothetical protein